MGCVVCRMLKVLEEMHCRKMCVLRRCLHLSRQQEPAH